LHVKRVDWFGGGGKYVWNFGGWEGGREFEEKETDRQNDVRKKE